MEVGGLLLKLFEFAMSKGSHLQCIVQSMPNKAKYTSSEIQNEVIHVIAKMVQEAITDECQISDLGIYSIKCDETCDANNIENISLVLRYMKSGM